MILCHFTAMENVEAIQREGQRTLPQGTLDGPASSFLGISRSSTSATRDVGNTDAERMAFRPRLQAVTIVSKRWLLFHTDQPLAQL